MILDANVVIALLDDTDTHHAAASDIVIAPDVALSIHTVTLAEALVVPVRRGLGSQASAIVTRDLGITPVTPDLSPLTLATLRSDTGLRLPDCIVLATAEEMAMSLATFDERLARVARGRGVEVHPTGP